MMKIEIAYLMHRAAFERHRKVHYERTSPSRGVSFQMVSTRGKAVFVLDAL